MPAMGASTTGTSSRSGPIVSAGVGGANRVDILSILSDRTPRRPDVTTGRERVAADAAARGIEVEFVDRTAASSLEEAAAILGITPADIVKSLVVKRADGTFLFAEIPGDRVISWPKLRALVGVNKLQLPDAGQALDATGYERGTITPLGSSTAWPGEVGERSAGPRVST